MDQMLIIKPPILTGWDSTFINRTNNFKEELKLMPGIKGTATSWRVPGVNWEELLMYDGLARDQKNDIQPVILELIMIS